MFVLALLSFLPGMVGNIAGGATVPFVLVLPGYVLTIALFGRHLDGFERLAITIGLGLAVLILGGLLLNMLPPGLDSVTWLAYIGFVTAVGMWTAAVRGSWDGIRWQPPTWHPRASLPVGLLSVSLLLVGGAIAFDIAGAQDQPKTTFTQLWMVPSHQGLSVSVGILNDEGSDVGYRLRVFVGGRTLADWRGIHLTNAQRWTRDLRVPGSVTKQHQAVHAALYRSGKSNAPYRTVDVYISG
jgi:uncharacterized membrane protein